MMGGCKRWSKDSKDQIRECGMGRKSGNGCDGCDWASANRLQLRLYLQTHSFRTSQGSGQVLWLCTQPLGFRPCPTLPLGDLKSQELLPPLGQALSLWHVMNRETLKKECRHSFCCWKAFVYLISPGLSAPLWADGSGGWRKLSPHGFHADSLSRLRFST